MDLGFRMHAERTPNPDSIKWVLGQPVAGDAHSAAFEGEVSKDESPLAAAILAVEEVVRVFLGPNFVTVTKREGAEWTDLAPPIVAEIKRWAASGDAAVGPAFEPPASVDVAGVSARIQEILEREIRPYVEQDGGEVRFAGFRDGIVEVVLQGACAGCPSSSITLKMGIEARLKEEIPEVQSVVAL